MSNLTITETRFRPREDLCAEAVEDDLLILDKRNQKIHQLNATARVIWANLGDGKGPKEIVQNVVEIFDISYEVAADDVRQVLQQLCDLDLLEQDCSY